MNEPIVNDNVLIEARGAALKQAIDLLRNAARVHKIYGDAAHAISRPYTDAADTLKAVLDTAKNVERLETRLIELDAAYAERVKRNEILHREITERQAELDRLVPAVEDAKRFLTTLKSNV
jgi:ABC-type transporter Mla subunit MlaD